MTWSMRTKRVGSTSMRRGRIWRHLDPGEAALAGLRVAQADRDRQAQRRDVRERVAGVDRERRQDREDLVEEALAQRRRGAPGSRRSRRARCPRRPARARTSTKIAECSATRSRTRCAGRGELLVGGPAVGRAGDLAGLDLLAQTGDRGPGRTRRGCRRRSPGTSPARAAGCARRAPRAGRAR